MISSFFYLFSISHSISISATQILFGILFIASLVIYYKTKEPLNFDKKLLTLFLIFFGFISLSVIINYSNFPTIKKVISKTFSWWHYLITFVAFYIAKVRKINLNNIFIFLFLGGAASSIYGLYKVLFTHSQRAEGFFSHALTFGNVTAIILIINYVIVILKLKNKSYHTLWYYILTLITMFLGLVFSLSRGPILSFFLTFIILNFFLLKKKGIIINTVIVMLAVFTVSYSPKLKTRFSDFFNNSWKVSTSSFGTRIVLWKTSIEIIRDNPIFGIGYDIKKEFKKRIKVPVSSMAHSHNSYLTIAAYYGIPAAILLISFLLYLIYLFGGAKDLFIRYSGISLVSVYSLEDLTEHNFGDSEVLMLFCFIVGVLLTRINLTKT